MKCEVMTYSVKYEVPAFMVKTKQFVSSVGFSLTNSSHYKNRATTKPYIKKMLAVNNDNFSLNDRQNEKLLNMNHRITQVRYSYLLLICSLTVVKTKLKRIIYC